MISPERAAELFEAAADNIDRLGWCKGSAVNNLGQVCAMGALYTATGVYDLEGEPYQQEVSSEMHHRLWLGRALGGILYRHLAQQYPWLEMVTIWNDDPRRTKDEVTTALRTVAKEQRMIAEGGE